MKDTFIKGDMLLKIVLRLGIPVMTLIGFLPRAKTIARQEIFINRAERFFYHLAIPG